MRLASARLVSIGPTADPGSWARRRRGRPRRRPARPARRPRAARQRLVRPLVVAADANRLERVEQLLLDAGVARVERLLIAPRLEDDEVPGTSDLLEELDADEAVLLAAGLAVLDEARPSLPWWMRISSRRTRRRRTWSRLVRRAGPEVRDPTAAVRSRRGETSPARLLPRVIGRRLLARRRPLAAAAAGATHRIAIDLARVLRATRGEGDVLAAKASVADWHSAERARHHLDTSASASARPEEAATCLRPWPARSTGAPCTSSCSPRVTCDVSSACQSSIVKVFDTTRVPGFISRILGRSRRLIEGSRNIVTTCAFEKSVSKRSAFTNVALSVTPAAFALRVRQLHHVRVVFNALRPQASLGRRDDRSPVARAKVHEKVLRSHLGQIEHALDQGLWRRHPDDVFAGLTDSGLERLGAGLSGLGMCRGGDQKNGSEQSQKVTRVTYGHSGSSPGSRWRAMRPIGYTVRHKISQPNSRGAAGPDRRDRLTDVSTAQRASP